MANLATCGYIQGLASLPLTCPSGYCGLNSILSAAGCCDSTVSVGETFSLTGCSYITACYAATDIASCAGDCVFNTRDLLCSDPASPECIKYTFTDISSAALFCSDQATVIDIAATSDGGAVETGSLRASPAGDGMTNAVATHTTFGAGSYTSSYIPQATSSAVAPATTSSAVAAGPQNPFTRTQLSGTHTGVVGTPTRVAGVACGKTGVSRVLRLFGVFIWGWALVGL